MLFQKKEKRRKSMNGDELEKHIFRCREIFELKPKNDAFIRTTEKINYEEEPTRKNQKKMDQVQLLRRKRKRKNQ